MLLNNNRSKKESMTSSFVSLRKKGAKQIGTNTLASLLIRHLLTVLKIRYQAKSDFFFPSGFLRDTRIP